MRSLSETSAIHNRATQRSCKASQAKTPSNMSILSLIASTMARSLTRILTIT